FPFGGRELYENGPAERAQLLGQMQSAVGNTENREPPQARTVFTQPGISDSEFGGALRGGGGTSTGIPRSGWDQKPLPPALSHTRAATILPGASTAGVANTGRPGFPYFAE